MSKWMLTKILLTLGILTILGGMPCAAQEQPDKGEAKAIAEEAYLYGFPMIVGYDVLYKYFIDRNSGQFKAPVNESGSVQAK